MTAARTKAARAAAALLTFLHHRLRASQEAVREGMASLWLPLAVGITCGLAIDFAVLTAFLVWRFF